MKSHRATTVSSKGARLAGNKIALLHVARRDLGLTDDDYRAVLRRLAFVEHTTDLDEVGFLAVVEHFKGLGFRSTWSQKNFGDRRGMASPAQIAKMRKLWAEYHGPDEKEVALNVWLTRFHHVSALRFVTSDKAGSVITALKAMAGRKVREG